MGTKAARSSVPPYIPGRNSKTGSVSKWCQGPGGPGGPGGRKNMAGPLGHEGFSVTNGGIPETTTTFSCTTASAQDMPLWCEPCPLKPTQLSKTGIRTAQFQCKILHTYLHPYNCFFKWWTFTIHRIGLFFWAGKTTCLGRNIHIYTCTSSDCCPLCAQCCGQPYPIASSEAITSPTKFRPFSSRHPNGQWLCQVQGRLCQFKNTACRSRKSGLPALLFPKPGMPHPRWSSSSTGGPLQVWNSQQAILSAWSEAEPWILARNQWPGISTESAKFWWEGRNYGYTMQRPTSQLWVLWLKTKHYHWLLHSGRHWWALRPSKWCVRTKLRFSQDLKKYGQNPDWHMTHSFWIRQNYIV